MTSTSLLRAACGRESAAWEDLVQTYSRRMYRWCRVAGMQPADAADVVQDAFNAVARSLPAFRRDRPGDTFRGWLRRIVDNKIRDHYRGASKRDERALGGTDAVEILAAAPAAAPGGPRDEDSTAPPPTPLDDRTSRVVEQVRNEVGERNWRMFWRTAVDGQPAADVGREFAASANAVRIVKMRVLRRLRAELGDDAAPSES